MERPAPRSHQRKTQGAAATGDRAGHRRHNRTGDSALRDNLVSDAFLPAEQATVDVDTSPHARPATGEEETALHRECVKLTEERLPLGLAYPRFMDVVHREIPFDHGTLYVAEGTPGLLIPVAVRGNRVELAEQVRFAKGSGLSAWVAQEGRPVIIPHPVQSTDRSPFADRGLRAFLAIPLTQQGEGIGVLALTRADRIFSKEEFDRLVRSGEYLAAILSRLRLQARYRGWVHTDPETGLSARHLFLARLEDELERARQHATEFSVVVLDFEGLDEMVAPGSGLNVREHLIRLFAERLQNGIRSCDMATLLDDGKFGILLAGVNRDMAVAILRRLASAALQGDSELPAGERSVRLRAGVAAFPEGGSSVDGLVEQARSELKLVS